MRTLGIGTLELIHRLTFLRFQIGGIIGKGSFGECRDCVCRISNVVCAVKVVEAKEDGGTWSSASIYKREVEFLRSLQHENVVRYVDSYRDKRNLYIITEKCTGGEIFERLLQQKKFSEVDVSSIFVQVFRAIEYIHSMGVVHRDIKAENFLFTSGGTIKLIDFGLAARVSGSEYLSAIVGSAHYLAPEMIRQRYWKPVDLWSAGVMMYLLLFGRYPFDGDNDDQIIRRIKRGDLGYTGNTHLSSDAMDLLQRLLDKDHRKRITAKEALMHRFVTFDDDRTEADDIEERAIPLSVKNQLRSAMSRRESADEKARKVSELRAEILRQRRRLSRTASVPRICRGEQQRLAIAALVSPNKKN